MLVLSAFSPRDEADAMRIADSCLFARLMLGVTSGLRLAINTTDTQQVFYLAIALDSKALTRVAPRFSADPAGLALLASDATIDSKHVDFAALKALPADTLGGAYVRALQAGGLDPDFFQRPPNMPADIAYIAQRARQSHDLWHVLTGFPTDVAGEVALQAFTDAQMNQNFSKMIVRFGLVFYGLRYPRMWGMVKRAYAAGKAARFLLTVRWEDWWADPLADVRVRVGLPATGLT